MGEFIEMPGLELYRSDPVMVSTGQETKAEPPPDVPAENVGISEELPEMPILNRKQILGKLEACKSHLSQVLCHLVHVSDTYEKTGNPGHNEMTKAIIVAFDAGYEMLDDMYKVC